MKEEDCASLHILISLKLMYVLYLKLVLGVYRFKKTRSKDLKYCRKTKELLNSFRSKTLFY